jgi:hypothetical protein
MKTLSLTLCCAAAAAILSCTDAPNLETAHRELLDLNDQMRTAHLEGDAATIIAVHDYPYTTVKNGRVTHPTPDDHAAQFKGYMDSMKLLAWDDLSEPIIHVSDDASLAVVTYRKHLKMVPKAQPESEPSEGIFVWQSTYKQTPNGWKQISDIVTTLPEAEMIEELQAPNNR